MSKIDDAFISYIQNNYGKVVLCSNPNTKIKVALENPKSKIKAGSLEIETDIHFGYIRKTMWKLFFGLKVENL